MHSLYAPRRRGWVPPENRLTSVSLSLHTFRANLITSKLHFSKEICHKSWTRWAQDTFRPTFDTGSMVLPTTSTASIPYHSVQDECSSIIHHDFYDLRYFDYRSQFSFDIRLAIPIPPSFLNSRRPLTGLNECSVFIHLRVLNSLPFFGTPFVFPSILFYYWLLYFRGSYFPPKTLISTAWYPSTRHLKNFTTFANSLHQNLRRTNYLQENIIIPFRHFSRTHPSRTTSSLFRTAPTITLVLG
jgi:hypothetical protein